MDLNLEEKLIGQLIYNILNYVNIVLYDSL